MTEHREDGQTDEPVESGEPEDADDEDEEEETLRGPGGEEPPAAA